VLAVQVVLLVLIMALVVDNLLLAVHQQMVVVVETGQPHLVLLHKLELCLVVLVVAQPQMLIWLFLEQAPMVV
jgi:hypothetical protein